MTCPLFNSLKSSRLIYNVKDDDQAVFCNLTQTERGKPMVKEAFRKMLSTLIESK